MPNLDYLGKGMKFPPEIDPATGRFKTSDGLQQIRESIYLVLMTARGERVMNRTYGSNILSYSFMDNNPTMIRIMTMELENAILNSEPRISSVNISIEPVDRRGVMMVNISYEVALLHQRDSMVFPFYLNQAEEESDTDAGPEGSGADTF